MARLVVKECSTPTGGDQTRLDEVMEYLRNNGLKPRKVDGRGQYIKIYVDDELMCSIMDVGELAHVLPRIKAWLGLSESNEGDD